MLILFKFDVHQRIWSVSQPMVVGPINLTIQSMSEADEEWRIANVSVMWQIEVEMCSYKHFQHPWAWHRFADSIGSIKISATETIDEDGNGRSINFFNCTSQRMAKKDNQFAQWHSRKLDFYSKKSHLLLSVFVIFICTRFISFICGAGKKKEAKTKCLAGNKMYLFCSKK